MSPNAKWYANWIRLLPASTEDEKLRKLEAADMLEMLDSDNSKLLSQIPKWNSVTDSLPTGFYVDECGYKEPEEYIVFIKGASVPTFAMYDGKNFIGICEGHEFVAEVTHWMPFQALQLPLEEIK